VLDPRAATHVGDVASVRGDLVRVRLNKTPSTAIMVGGELYRVGQIGAFVRIPMGYASLYGVCTQVGADAAPTGETLRIEPLLSPDIEALAGVRWMQVALFGESLGGHFDRGVSQYPTVGDQVHVATPTDLDVVYGTAIGKDSLEIGRIAASDIPARLQLSNLVNRHSSVVGSTGSGKSNLVAVILETLTGGDYPSARLLVIDPHAEYDSVLGDRARVVRAGADVASGEVPLRVPYWALPFDELFGMTMGEMQPHIVEAIRDRVRDLKVGAAAHLTPPPPAEAITADSPVPFSIRSLWYELEDEERATFNESNKQDDETRYPREDDGDLDTLRPPRYPPATSLNTAPYHNKKRRGIGRQLDLLRTRILDARFAFMFDPRDALHPDAEGRVGQDLGALLTEWVGGEKQVTILDVSSVPAEVLGTVIGTMLRIVYDALFWAMDLPSGGRAQPLLVILDEAHRFLPSGGAGPAHRIFTRIAKEGRKYGVGLMVVSQRPSDLDANILSQCGTMIALRVTNEGDRSTVAGAIPDTLGGLTELLPSLRTGEALVLGDALQVPSRVRIRRARNKPVGEDPALPAAWQRPERPAEALFDNAVTNWRAQSTSASVRLEREAK
jgi:DNA helicase HerA-like ATPase